MRRERSGAPAQQTHPMQGQQTRLSPPKTTKECRTGSDIAATSSTSSESELDSVSIESLPKEAETKDNMKTDHRAQYHLPWITNRNQGGKDGSPTEISSTYIRDPEQKQPKKGIWKLINTIADMSVGRSNGKSKSNDLKQEEYKPVTVDQIRRLIEDKQFSEAGQHLIDMEKEAYGDSCSKSEEERMKDQPEIEALFTLLKTKVFCVIHSSPVIALTQPELVKSAVRTLAQQVNEDKRYLDKATGKSDCSRPRKWQEDWRCTVQASVAERMKEPPFADNKGLSATAHCFLHMGTTMKSDLLTVVQHIKPHYPDDFQVCSTYAKCYYCSFASQLEAIAQFELDTKDTHLLLTWVLNFYPNEIKNHPVLAKELDEACLGSLLPQERIKQLEELYLMNEVDSVKRWLTKCLQMEVARWIQGREPEKLDGHFHSELPIDAIQTIYGGQKRAKDITPDLGKQVTRLLLVELFTFLKSYKKELEMFIKEKKQHKYFVATIIANMNNCSSFWTHTEESTVSAQDIKEKVFSTLHEIQGTGFEVLLQGLFQELTPLFKKFTQKKWLSCTGIMDEIIATTSHHISMFKTLKDPLRQAIMEKIHFHLVQEHITRLMKKKVSMKSPEQQNILSELIQKNASILYTFCTENGSNATWLDSALPRLAEILKLQDINAIMLEVGTLANKYPDISKKHLAAILYIKANLSSSESRSILSVLDISVTDTLPRTALFSTIKAS